MPMTRIRYTVVLTEDIEDGGFIASVPALQGCHTSGETEEEAYENALEAIGVYLDSLAEHGEPIPTEAGSRTVTVS